LVGLVGGRVFLRLGSGSPEIEFIRINSISALVAERSGGRFFEWAGGATDRRHAAGAIFLAQVGYYVEKIGGRAFPQTIY
jgi:hypothetical protein